MDRVIVAGGGAAGMMAAIAAASAGAEVLLLERNEKLGKKLYITGKGRCNVTNDCAVEELLDHVVTNRKFLYSAFYGFSSRDMQDFLESRGLRLKVERGNRVFPASDKASDVTACLSAELSGLGVSVRLGTRVERLSFSETADGKRAVSGVVTETGGALFADRVIVACGGMSYPSTGSTGDGYRLAVQAGHTVTELSPALCPFEAAEPFVKELQGLSLRNVGVRLTQGKKRIYEEFGEMLFTHFGVSGPAVLSASSLAAKPLKKGPLTLHIDLKPALSPEQLDARILRDFEGEKNRQFSNALGGLFPAKLIPVMVERSGIHGEKRVNAVTREERARLLALTKDFTVTLTGLRGFKEAIITQGGVKVGEVDPGTMESKLVKGLYFAGEVLDLDGFTGGYNLQIAWSTGRLAGLCAAGSRSE